MNKKYNTLHKYIYEYSNGEYTKETLDGLFRSILRPLADNPKTEACILFKISDLEDKKGIIKRLLYSEREIYSFNDNLKTEGINNVIKENLWDTTDFVIISAKRYSAVLIFDFEISEQNNRAKTCLMLNSKAVSDVLKTVFENSLVTRSKDILKKYNADRRENIILNSAISNITNLLDEKNSEMNFAEQNKPANTDFEKIQTAETVEKTAKLISHEIKNNLSLINLYSTILKKKLEISGCDDEISSSVNDTLKNILNSSNNISSFISDLRCISAPEITEINIKEELNSRINGCLPLLKEKNIKINAELIDTPAVKTDRTKLDCAITNIIFNAADTTASEITVKTETDKDYVRIFIENDGEKISDEIKNKIFDKEFTTKQNGNGLGLYIIKNQLSRIGCEVNLVKSDDKSTVFEIKIPL